MAQPSSSILPSPENQQIFHVGRVVSVDTDPDRFLRVRVRVLDIHTDGVPDSDLPLAEYLLPVGSRPNDGFFTPVDPGDMVWVMFPYRGDIRRPMIVGSIHFAPDRKPNLPHEAWQGQDAIAHRITGDQPAPTGAQYHEKAAYTQHGVTLEVNQDGSWVVSQRATGTEIHVSPAGDLVLHCEATIHISAAQDQKILISGESEVKIDGRSSVEIGGVSMVKVQGPHTQISGGPMIIKGSPVMIN